MFNSKNTYDCQNVINEDILLFRTWGRGKRTNYDLAYPSNKSSLAEKAPDYLKIVRNVNVEFD